MSWKIPLSDLNFGAEEEAAVLRVLRSGWLSQGPETEAFEQEFADYLGVKHAIAVANGTAALHLALLGIGIDSGDAVIQPAVNFVSAANMTVAVGALPVFADICSLDEPTISPQSAQQAIEACLAAGGPKPKAVVVMHYGGYPCRMRDLEALCKAQDLWLIEDACHGVGASVAMSDKGVVKLGAVGDVGCFSFFANKNLVTGEGGMVTTNSDELARKIRLLRSHGMTTLTWQRHQGHAATYDVVEHGLNYRFDEIRAAIGRLQLGRLDENNARRRELSAAYFERLTPLQDDGWIFPFQIQQKSQQECMASAHLFTAVAPDTATRWKCTDALKEQGIQTSLHYPLVPKFDAFSNFALNDEVGVSRQFCERTITLPLYPSMVKNQVTAVTRALIEATG
ncbi:DegT/DnrJ/EryC1/StrS family aminotransferase [Pseudomonadota bacterium]